MNQQEPTIEVMAPTNGQPTANSPDVVIRDLPPLPRIQLADEAGNVFGSVETMEILAIMFQQGTQTTPLESIKRIQQHIHTKFKRVISSETCAKIMAAVEQITNDQKKNTSNGADSPSTDSTPTA